MKKWWRTQSVSCPGTQADHETVANVPAGLALQLRGEPRSQGPLPGPPTREGPAGGLRRGGCCPELQAGRGARDSPREGQPGSVAVAWSSWSRHPLGASLSRSSRKSGGGGDRGPGGNWSPAVSSFPQARAGWPLPVPLTPSPWDSSPPTAFPSSFITSIPHVSPGHWPRAGAGATKQRFPPASAHPGGRSAVRSFKITAVTDDAAKSQTCSGGSSTHRPTSRSPERPSMPLPTGTPTPDVR